MASVAPQGTRVESVGTVQVLHDHRIASLCQMVVQQMRTTERERQGTLAALKGRWDWLFRVQTPGG